MLIHLQPRAGSGLHNLAKFLLVWLALCQLDINYSHLEEEISIEKMHPLDWPVGKPLLHFLDRSLMQAGHAHLLCSINPGLVVLSIINM